MEKHNISFDMEVYQAGETPTEYAALISLAIEFRGKAYAPYSNFLVGAAVLTASGKILGGANQENASYPLCMCGERVALYHSAMALPGDPVVAVAIVVKSPMGAVLNPVMPCGACRQVLKEYEDRYGNDIKIIIRTDDERVWVVNSVKDLLPLGFDNTFLI